MLRSKQIIVAALTAVLSCSIAGAQRPDGPSFDPDVLPDRPKAPARPALPKPGAILELGVSTKWASGRLETGDRTMKQGALKGSRYDLWKLRVDRGVVYQITMRVNPIGREEQPRFQSHLLVRDETGKILGERKGKPVVVNVIESIPDPYSGGGQGRGAICFYGSESTVTFVAPASGEVWIFATSSGARRSGGYLLRAGTRAFGGGGIGVEQERRNRSNGQGAGASQDGESGIQLPAMPTGRSYPNPFAGKVDRVAKERAKLLGQIHGDRMKRGLTDPYHTR